jgi:signal transduction histidine kinase
MNLFRRSQPVSLRHAAATIFAITAVLPLLLFLHVLWRFEILAQPEAQVGLFLALIVALLGFVLFHRIVHRISALVHSLTGPTPGTSIDIPAASVPGIGLVAEAGQMAESFRRLLEELRASTERLQDLVFKLGTLNDLVEMAGRIPNTQELLGVVLDRTMRTVGATIGSIMLLDSERKTLRVVAARGLPGDLAAGLTTNVGEGIAGKVAALGEPVLVRDIETDARFARPNDPKYGSGSFICLPIRVADRVIGVVNLAKKDYASVENLPGAFTPIDLQFLNALMTYIAYAVDNARLIEEARHAATRLQQVVEDQEVRLTQAQQQMLQAAKLSALGQLVAGVAHELNNPIMAMLGLSELMRDQVPEAIRGEVQLIHDSAQQAQAIVQGLLTFARRRTPERGPVELPKLLQRVIRVTAADLQVAKVALEIDLAPDLPAIHADEGQLQQVLVNLITNARQALADVGGEQRLTIAMKSADADRVQIVVKDTGPGIPADLLPHIFDPFVSTKGTRGTGLGLSISYGIIQEHQGQLSVESTPGRGATFTIELPVGTLAPREDLPEPSAELAGRRILVVEDDARVQRLTCEYLETAACTAIGVPSAEDALAHLTGPLDLVLSDLYLPGIDGFALCKETAARRPDLGDRFVIMTGGVVAEAELEQHGTKVLQKPFSRAQLLAVVREALGANPAMGDRLDDGASRSLESHSRALR